MSELNKDGKIYKIEPLNGDEGDIYIGSTTQKYLSSRMNQHRSSYTRELNFCKSYLLFDKYGIENCNIILLEMVNVNNKMELHQRESYYIKLLKCINKNIPLRTIEEYREANKDKIKDKIKEYYEANKDKKKEYYEANKDKIKGKKKQIEKNKIYEKK